MSARDIRVVPSDFAPPPLGKNTPKLAVLLFKFILTEKEQFEIYSLMIRTKEYSLRVCVHVSIYRRDACACI